MHQLIESMEELLGIRLTNTNNVDLQCYVGILKIGIGENN
jgi:hypothetical protein